jgi:tRNA(Ile)-lysidine synthase
VNHKLRHADSEADQAFVQALCGQLGLACEVQTAAVNPIVDSRGQGLEAAARRARYAVLEEIAGRVGARFVVTAHTADDQAETILHRILRGTGLRGLRGMSRWRRLGPATLLRPLLGIVRAELAEYLRDRKQAYRTDASNLDLRYMRNRIRKELLPLLATHYNPAIVQALLRLGDLAGESQTLVDSIVYDVTQQCLRRIGPNEISLDLSILARQSPHLIREVLLDAWRQQAWPLVSMGFAEWESLATMILAAGEPAIGAPRKRTLPGAIMAEILDGELRLEVSISATGNRSG